VIFTAALKNDHHHPTNWLYFTLPASPFPFPKSLNRFQGGAQSTLGEAGKPAIQFFKNNPKSLCLFALWLNLPKGIQNSHPSQAIVPTGDGTFRQI